MKTARGSSEIKTITTHYIDGAFVESHGREASKKAPQCWSAARGIRPVLRRGTS
jgi:hypothetical protein